MFIRLIQVEKASKLSGVLWNNESLPLWSLLTLYLNMGSKYNKKMSETYSVRR